MQLLLPHIFLCKYAVIIHLCSVAFLDFLYCFSTLSPPASPPATYATIEMVHYIILPSPESNRSIVLSCAVRPGALAGRYSVVWEQVDQNNNSFIDENKPNILVDVESTSTTPSQYQCNVTIQHNNVTSVSYTPPPVTVHYKGKGFSVFLECSMICSVLSHSQIVLSTLAEEIGNVSVTVGEPATFYCGVLKRDTDFNITWRIDNNEYICDRYNTVSSDSNIFCSFNDSLSVLQIKDTGSLGGTHTVQCVLQQIIPENFTSDGSFLAGFGDNVVMEAVLTVTGELLHQVLYQNAAAKRAFSRARSVLASFPRPLLALKAAWKRGYI